MLLFVAAGAPSLFVDRVGQTAPFVGDDYLEFLRPMERSSTTLYFSVPRQSQFPSLIGANATRRGIVDSRQHFVIGADPGGSAFMLRQDGAVILV
ncbi:MAG TPA: hypothetical protein VFN10_20725 [Thermoanaerobaculia bacterium]|nr:hypothetical protein [Thermoanaerobaculia bacterium]